MEKMKEPDKVILQVQWALQEAYKIAVHNAGISDWSVVPSQRKRQVELDQLKIARLILEEARNQ
jgi:hypothetical protein